MADAPIFIENDLQQIIDEMVSDYEARAGVVLQPAQVERLLINSFAYRESLVRGKIQYAGTQNLVDFSSAPVLDYLGQLLGVSRLAASSASAIIRFSIVPGHGGVIIPQGTRVATVDGAAVFVTGSDYLVPVDDVTADLVMESITEGTVGNGYAVDTIITILDPQPFLEGATNISISGGGAEQEDDDALRARIKLAPASFSTAGPRDACKYFALSASPSIIDVTVLGPPDGVPPGEVHIYPLMEDGEETPETVLDAVYAAVNYEKVRPLSDLVIVTSPTSSEFEIEVELVIYTDADPASIESQVQQALDAYVLGKRQTLGQDIKRSQIIGECMIPGEVYDVNVIQPAADIVLDQTSFGKCTGITVTITGTNNG